MSMRVTVNGEQEFDAAMERLKTKFSNAMIKEVNKGSVAIHKTMVESVQSSSGRHTQYSNGRFSSPPDSPPNTQTGNLAGRIIISQVATATKPESEITSFASYSAALEFGTKHMEPRPFMQPAMDAHIGDIKENIKSAMRKALRAGVK